MNRDENLTTDESVTGQSEVESKQSYSPLLSVEVATTFTNDSDELELTTSECSEPDMNWQSHLPKTTAISNVLASRPNKSTHYKQAKNLETRYCCISCCLSSFQGSYYYQLLTYFISFPITF